MLPALYRYSANQSTSDGLVSVLQGSCFGGSTVINAGDCEPTPPEVYAHWKRLVGLSQLDERTLEASEQRVLAMLQVNEIPRAEVNRNNAIVLDGAQKLGLRPASSVTNAWVVARLLHDRFADAGAHLTWLPRAVAAGADVNRRARRAHLLAPRASAAVLQRDRRAWPASACRCGSSAARGYRLAPSHWLSCTRRASTGCRSSARMCRCSRRCP